MIGIWQRFQRNFELTVFELTVPDLYMRLSSINEISHQEHSQLNAVKVSRGGSLAQARSNKQCFSVPTAWGRKKFK